MRLIPFRPVRRRARLRVRDRLDEAADRTLQRARWRVLDRPRKARAVDSLPAGACYSHASRSAAAPDTARKTCPAVL